MTSLEGTSATRRHIILLTDGWSTSGQYDAILAKMKADGITLSTVGAGGGANPFLEQLAKQGGGRFYAATNPASIPDIFLKETQQVSGQQIVEEPFFPIQTSSSPILRGLDAGLPQLRGYNGTTIKPAAQSVLVTSRDDPLLAQWQYGLGRSVAWTSDSTGRWAKDWVGWSGFNRFFSQLVSWTFPGEETGGIEATFETTGTTTGLHVESVEPDGSPRDFYATSAVVVGPDLEPRTVDLVQVAPGVYQAPLGEIDPGAYAVRITQTRPGSSPLGRTVGLVAPTAAEYRQLGANEPFLASVRAAAGGSVIATATDPWIHDLTTTNRFTDLWPLLLVLALLLWPLDIALRRMSLGRRELAAARGWVGGIGRRRRAAGPRTATAEGLLAASERVRTGGTRAAMRAPADPRAGRRRLRSPPRRPRRRGRPRRRRQSRSSPAPARRHPRSRPQASHAARARAGRRRRHDVPPPRRQTPRPRPLTRRVGGDLSATGGSLGSMSLPRAVGLGFVALLVAACSSSRPVRPPRRRPISRASRSSSRSAACMSTTPSRATRAATIRSWRRRRSRSTSPARTRRRRSRSTSTSSATRRPTSACARPSTPAPART